MGSLDDVNAAFTRIGDMFRAEDYSQACAIGVWTDDPESPSVTAVVFQGRLYSLVVAEAWRRRDPRDLTDVVNAVLINAFAEWSIDKERLFDSASTRSA